MQADNYDDIYTICVHCCDFQALAEAIQSVTEMNQDLAVEKIEIETATDLEVNGPKWFCRMDHFYIYDKLSGQRRGAWLKLMADVACQLCSSSRV